MPKSDEARLRHMLDAAREATLLTRGRSRQDLDRDRLLNLSLVRLLEIIGEAARRVSEETRARHAEIPWPRIAGMRNHLIHGYDEVDHDIVWRVTTGDLPPLITQLEKILSTGF